jgi:hypothetical protein
LSPGLFTRTETLTLVGWLCAAPELEDAEPEVSWDPDELSFAPDCAAAVFCWVTAPSSPELPTRTETLMFPGEDCVAVAEALAAASVAEPTALSAAD